MAKGFHGGLWLDLKIQPASERPVEVLPAPRLITLPLHGHFGGHWVPSVAKGDTVGFGQVIAHWADDPQFPLRAPVSGSVKYSIPEGDGRPAAVVIENDGRDYAAETPPQPADPGALTADDICAAARRAGIFVAEGRGEPLWRKLRRMREDGVDTLVLNAVETEPYLCSAQKLLSENPDDVARGLALAMKAVGASRLVLAVGDSVAREVVADMLESAHLEGADMTLRRVPPKYPSGNEKYLTGLLFGGRGEKPSKPGFVSAEECLHLMRAAVYGIPQVTRIVTVAGEAAENPQNVEVRLGTSVRDVLEYCGLKLDPERVVLGSAMRGTAVETLDTPVTADVSAVLALVPVRRAAMRSMCINCGRCVRVCPEKLMPNYIAMRAVLADFDACRALHIESCIECGACAFVCPGRMPIVELIKNIKKAAAAGGRDGE